MEPTEINEFIENYEVALAQAPQEVRDFLWSDAFEGIINGIAKTCNLNEVQKKAARDVLFDTVLGVTGEKESVEKLTAVGVSTETQDKIFAIGYEYVVAPSIEEVEKEFDEETSVPATHSGLPIVSIAPSPTDVLKNIQERLVAPTVIPPQQTQQQAEKTIPSGIKKIDPYREGVE